MKSLISFLLLIGVVVWSASAQPLTEIPYDFKLEAADESFTNKDYYNAVDWYEQCYKETRQLDLAQKIGFCHYKLRDYRRAERWYKRVIDKDKEMIYPQARFDYGRLLKYNAKYDEAEQVFREFSQHEKSQSFKDWIQIELAGIDLAKTMKVPDDLLVENAGRKINGRNMESSPALSPEGELYYVSIDSDEILKVTSKNEDFHYKIFQSRRTDRGDWQKGKEVSEKINRPGYHNSHVSFSRDGERMYFTRAIVSGGEIISSDLYYSDNTRGGWGAPQPISSLNGDFLNQHPVTGELFGQDVLIFSSNQPGGSGGLDLYYAPVDRDGTFGQAVNLGNRINSIGNEVTPFFGEAMLYFSSDGHPSMGGYDIFKSEWDGASLGTPQNMGKGFSSSVDDLYFTLGDEESGFLVSNRDGTRSVKSATCCDDIFTFAKKEIIIKLLASVFEEGEDERPLPGATIKLYQKIGEELGFPDVQENEEGNEFDFALDADKAYKVLVEREGFYPDTADFNTVGVRESKNFRGTFRLKPMPEEPEVEILTINEPIRLNNIYYEFDDDQILPDAEGDLDFVFDLMTQYPDMVIELSSHTDARGPDAYNENLSQRRANSAKQYLELLGIDGDRVRAVGYGEKRILNKCVNGVNCTEAEHRLNRRTEFTILEGPQTIEIRKEIKKAPTGGDDGDDGGSASLNFTNPDATSSAKTAIKYPKIQFENESVNLGSVQQGEKKKYSFSFRNAGEADLIIDLATACECTELDWPRDPIKPGQTGLIDVEYDSTDKEGQQEVTVDVIANTEPIVTQATFTIFVEKVN